MELAYLGITELEIRHTNQSGLAFFLDFLTALFSVYLYQPALICLFILILIVSKFPFLSLFDIFVFFCFHFTKVFLTCFNISR